MKEESIGVCGGDEFIFSKEEWKKHQEKEKEA